MNNIVTIMLIVLGTFGLTRIAQAFAPKKPIAFPSTKQPVIPLPAIKTPTYYSDWVTPSTGQKYEQWFLEASRLYQLPPGLLSRVAYQESHYNPNAISPVGAQGLMQIMPKWHPNVNPFDPREAIFYGANYLRENFNRFKSWDKALAAYNWGPGNLSNAITQKGNEWLTIAPAETKNYVKNIMNDTGLAA